jgi:glycosyltransferase involved in cell wall biosynthesis
MILICLEKQRGGNEQLLQVLRNKIKAMRSKPKFSVIIPMFNSEKTLIEALYSALKQLSEKDEVIIVDDGSTDSSYKLAQQMQDPRIRLLKNDKNKGISFSRNKALEVATGDYITFLDADDVWPETRHEKVLAVIGAEHPDIISGMIEHFYCPSLAEKKARKYRLPEMQHGSVPGSVIIKKTCTDKAGLFDVSLECGEFIDFISRIKKQEVKWSKLDRVILRRRIHGGNHTLMQREKQVDYLKVIRKHLARQKEHE